MADNAEISATNNGTEKHIIFFQHGLHADHSDYVNIIKFVKERYPDLVLKSCESNSFRMATHQGIDKCGERLAQEINTVCSDVKPTRISIVGHSLGGPITRYAIGILYEQGFFNNIKPIQYISLSSPHCGSRRPKRGFYNKLAGAYTNSMFHETGRQLMLTDDEKNPLLLDMTRLDGRYYLGLQLFQDRSLYSTIENDLHVMFNTSNISHENPYTKNDVLTQSKLSEKYPHFIHTDSIPEFVKMPESGDEIFKNDEKGHILKQIVTNLQTLEYTRHHMKFSNFLSHTHIIMKREFVNKEGLDVVMHFVDHLIVDSRN